MGTPAARTECLVDVCVRGAGGRFAAAHDHPRLQCHRDRAAMIGATSSRNPSPSFRWRLTLLFGLLSAAALALAGVAVQLQLVDHGFLAQKGDARSMRVVATAAH